MRDERPLPGPEVSNEMHDGGRCYVPHSPDFGQMLQECQSPGLRLVEEVRHVLLSLTWDIDSVLVSFTGDINHVSSDSSDLKHLTGTDHSLVRPQLTEPQSQQNWRSEDQDGLHHVTIWPHQDLLQPVNHGQSQWGSNYALWEEKACREWICESVITTPANDNCLPSPQKL